MPIYAANLIMFALSISMPCLKSIIFYENSPLSYFCKKNVKFSSVGGSPSNPRASGGWGFCPKTSKYSSPIANFWLRAWSATNIKLTASLKDRVLKLAQKISLSCPAGVLDLTKSQICSRSYIFLNHCSI